MRPPGAGDRGNEVAAEVGGQPTVAVGVESCETEHLPRTFPAFSGWWLVQ
jgi:hypothetical protein